jgi:hypothetical protein
MRENIDPNLTATLNKSRHGDTGSFDLVGGDPCAFFGNKSVFAVCDYITLLRRALHAASMLSSSFYSLRD